MDLHLYTRGGPRPADHRFVGPGTPEWWAADLAYWLGTERPTLIARQRDDRFEVALCGLPTSRSVVDGTPIANLLVLGAPVGSPDAHVALAAAHAWFTALADEQPSSEVAELIDETISTDLVDANLGVESDATAAALDALEQALRQRYADRTVHDGEVDPGTDWLGSIGSPEARDAFVGLLARLAEGTAPDGTLAAHLNRARAEADGREALAHLRSPGAVLLLGDELRHVMPAASTSAPREAPDPKALLARLAERRAIRWVAALAALMMMSGLVVVAVLVLRRLTDGS